MAKMACVVLKLPGCKQGVSVSVVVGGADLWEGWGEETLNHWWLITGVTGLLPHWPPARSYPWDRDNWKSIKIGGSKIRKSTDCVSAGKIGLNCCFQSKRMCTLQTGAKIGILKYLVSIDIRQ